MRSAINSDFRRRLARLPEPVRRTAARRYRAWRADPFAGPFHFEEVLPGVWSVRVNDDYRALGRRNGELILRFWIGSHAEYDRLLAAR